MMAVPGLAEAITRMKREAENTKRWKQLRYDAGRMLMEDCAKQSAQSVGGSKRLTASFWRRTYRGQKEWIFEERGLDAVEVGTTVPGAVKLGANRYMRAAMQRMPEKLTRRSAAFIKASGKAAGFDVSE